MKLERKYAFLLLCALYVIILIGMYEALIVLGPLSPESLRWIGDPMEQGYRIFFFSMPNAAVVYLAFFVILIASIMYLRDRQIRWDLIASGSAKLGLVFCTILLITGSIFSNLAWGAYWNWDPQQTAALVLWFILAGYLSLRSAIEDDEARARLSAIFGIFGFLGVPLSYVSAVIWSSIHPRFATGFSLDPLGKLVTIIIVLGLLILFAYLLWLEVSAKKLEKEYQRLLSKAKREE
ncbi:MAG: cytochrome c biogenesis protein [Euryarchaeota archaeon]|nr:cytochrome c biogenesis protein [Euryarchaeota archaeon]